MTVKTFGVDYVPPTAITIPESTYTAEKGDYLTVLFAPRLMSETIEVPQYEKLELGIRLPVNLKVAVSGYVNKVFKSEKVNPFDPNQIDVYATLTHVATGRKFRVNGFYYEEFRRETHARDPEHWQWVQDTSSFDFRIRCAPNLSGEWLVETTVESARAKYSGRAFRFTATPSDSPGYLVKGEEGNANDRYLRFENGQPYIPIGETIGYLHWWALRPQDFRSVERYCSEISEAGGNFVRLWMNLGGFLIEREKLGDYGRNYNEAYKKEINRQTNAWELDRAFQFARSLDMRVMLAVFGSEMDDSNPKYGPQPPNWEHNPYRNTLGLEKQAEVFLNDSALIYQKRRMRYTLARWGYDTHFAVCEIIGEPAKFSGDHSKEAEKGLERWITSMSDLVHENAYPKLTIIDFTNTNSGNGYRRNYWKNTTLDFGSSNDYRTDKKSNFDGRWRQSVFWRSGSVLHKPFWLCEVGAGIFPNIDYATDIEFHNVLWSSMFNGSCAPAIEYWWDRIHADGAQHQHNFYPLSVFLKDLNLTKGEFTQQRWKDGLMYDGIVTYTLVSESNDTAYGWAHNTHYWWRNMRYTDPDVKIMIDSCSGSVLTYPNGQPVDKADQTDYCNEKAFPSLGYAPQHVKGRSIRIKNMDPFAKYRIEWYDTHKDGRHLSEFDEVRRSGIGAFGTANVAFTFPALDNESYGYQDFAFKVYKLK